MTRSFRTVFDPHRNALNAVRLVMALSVIVWHSFALSGNTLPEGPLRQLLGQVGVDGFFAISGFLIVSSWHRTPRWRTYLLARCLRILPAYWVCLAVTALVFAPVVAGVFGGENLTYIVDNFFLWVGQKDIAGTPLDIPFEHIWNGSLWTLGWEFLCYLGVMLLGVVGLLLRRATIPLLFAAAWAASLIVAAGLVENDYVVQGSRFGLMFLGGAVIWRFQDKVPVTLPAIVVSAAIVGASLWLPDYRLAGALPVAYLVLCVGALLTSPRLRLRNDISYGTYIYAFPAQQVLAIWGAWELGVAVFALLSVAATIPLAAASWFVVEKPAMRLRRRWAPARPVTAAAEVGATPMPE